MYMCTGHGATVSLLPGTDPGTPMDPLLHPTDLAHRANEKTTKLVVQDVKDRLHQLYF